MHHRNTIIAPYQRSHFVGLCISNHDTATKESLLRLWCDPGARVPFIWRRATRAGTPTCAAHHQTTTPLAPRLGVAGRPVPAGFAAALRALRLPKLQCHQTRARRVLLALHLTPRSSLRDANFFCPSTAGHFPTPQADAA